MNPPLPKRYEKLSPHPLESLPPPTADAPRTPTSARTAHAASAQSKRPFTPRGALMLLARFSRRLARGGVSTGRRPRSAVLWSIGTVGSVGIEFAPVRAINSPTPSAKSVPSKDFAGHQTGSVALTRRRRTKPYTIAFDLKEPPSGAYHLALDLIYRSGAPGRSKVKVNNRRHLPRPSRAEEEQLRREANVMLMAKQHLIVPIDAASLKQPVIERSRSRRSASAGGITTPWLSCAARVTLKLRLEPTIAFSRVAGQARGNRQLVVRFQKQRIANGTADLRLAKTNSARRSAAANMTSARVDAAIEVPAQSQPSTASLHSRATARRNATHEFKPAKQWRVFVCPKVPQHDVGYTDLQHRTWTVGQPQLGSGSGHPGRSSRSIRFNLWDRLARR